MKDLVGQLIAGKYRITQRIGGGGVADVFEAIHERLGQHFAIKVLRKEFARFPAITRRFLTEGRAASAVKHPGIIQVYDVDQLDTGELYIVMELLQGQELSAALEAERQFDVAHAIDLTLQILDALEAAHHAGVIHRDLKPENVLLLEGPDGREQVKIIDFGVARLSREGPAALRKTTEGSIVGTPYYISPEQARGESNIDRRTDVYAVGVMLFEMLTGELPYGGTSVQGIIKKVLEDPFPSVRQIEPSVPPELEQVIRKAASRKREDRYASATEFARALRAVLDGSAADAEDAAPTGRLGDYAEPVADVDPLDEAAMERPTLPAPEGYDEAAAAAADSAVPPFGRRLPSPSRSRGVSQTTEGVDLPRVQTVVVLPARIWLYVVVGALFAAGVVGALFYFVFRTDGRDANQPRVAAPLADGTSTVSSLPPEKEPDAVAVAAAPDAGGVVERPDAGPDAEPLVKPAAEAGGDAPDAGAPEAAGGAKAVVQLTRLPRGAVVTLDDQPVESTFEVSVREESHQIRVDAPGWKPWVRTLRITGDAVISVDMERRGTGPATSSDAGAAAVDAGGRLLDARPLANPFGDA